MLSAHQTSVSAHSFGIACIIMATVGLLALMALPAVVALALLGM